MQKLIREQDETPHFLPDMAINGKKNKKQDSKKASSKKIKSIQKSPKLAKNLQKSPKIPKKNSIYQEL
jgi:hypothetical protein